MTTKRITKGDKVIISPSINEEDLTDYQRELQKEKVIGTVIGRMSQSVVLVQFPPTAAYPNSHSAPFMDVELINLNNVLTKEK